MDTRELVALIASHFYKGLDGFEAAIREFELGSLANAHVAMGKQSRQVLEWTLLHSFGAKMFGFENEVIAVHVRIVNAIDATFAGLIPAANPICEINSAVHTELH